MLVVKLASSWWALASGFRAISDDDYARVVIAERFASSPAWDPSGTSWLPLPFWLTGSAMMLFEPSLAVARATAVALGVAAAMLVWLAARVAGASSRGALLAALLGAAFPYSAYLGVATVPEAYTAALLVLGAASLSAPHPSAVTPWAGALAIAAATLCRYEAWPVAAVFAAVLAMRAAKGPEARTSELTRGLETASPTPEKRARLPNTLGPALVAIAPPLAWMAHGAVSHDAALFFVRRVTEYRHALGDPAAMASGLAEVPVAFFLHEPELVSLFVVTLALAAFTGALRGASHLRPFAIALGAIPVFLIAGALRGSGATHHPERSLVPLWYGSAVFVGVVAGPTLRRLSTRARLLAAAVTSMVVVAAAAGIRPASGRQPFARRSLEVEVGRAVAALPSNGRVAIDTPDYGFFAIMAALGDPDRTEPLRHHDPRRPEPPLDLGAPDTAAALRRRGVSLLVAHRAHAADAATLGRERFRNHAFVVIELGEAPSLRD